MDWFQPKFFEIIISFFFPHTQQNTSCNCFTCESHSSMLQFSQAVQTVHNLCIISNSACNNSHPIITLSILANSSNIPWKFRIDKDEYKPIYTICSRSLYAKLTFVTTIHLTIISISCDYYRYLRIETDSNRITVIDWPHTNRQLKSHTECIVWYYSSVHLYLLFEYELNHSWKIVHKAI